MKAKWSSITLLVACALMMSTIAVTEQSVVVTTRYGALRGTRTTTGPDSYVDTFYNIPYAKPPVGELRFQRPQANEAWTGTRDATAEGPMCPQPPMPVYTQTNVTHMGTEDCLYLNVYTPKISEGDDPLPVMLYVHGGGFYLGTANFFNMTNLASMGVVVVSINYRIGALGFLSTLDSESVGNYGLWDQVLALRWVRDVISSFNGDPQDVTVFGESAGSAAVSLLVMSTAARGLFSKAIMESGVSLSPWAVSQLTLDLAVDFVCGDGGADDGGGGLFNKAIMESGVSLSPWAVGLPSTQPQPRQQALDLASRLGCDAGQDTAWAVACLRTRSADDIVDVTTSMDVDNDYRITFRPVVETTFGETGMFAATPDVILANGWFNNVTVIRGYNKDEASLGLESIDPELDGFTMEEFMNMTRTFVENAVSKQYPAVDVDRLMELVVDAYVTRPQITDPEELRAAFVQMMTDNDYRAPTTKEIQLWSAAHGTTQYLYRFNYRAPNRVTHAWQGVSHADEVNYVFGYDVLVFSMGEFVTSWTDDDTLMAQQMMTWWTDFAKSGNPTPGGNGSTKWLPWTQDTPRYFDLDLDPEMVSAPDTPTIRLWNEVIPNLARSVASEIVG